MKDIIRRQGVVCCLASVKNTLRNFTKTILFHLTYPCTSLVIVALTTADHPKNCWLKTTTQALDIPKDVELCQVPTCHQPQFLEDSRHTFFLEIHTKQLPVPVERKHVFPSVRCTSKRSCRAVFLGASD